MAMHYSMWRGVAGLVKPTRRPGSLETLIRLLPEGIGVVPLLLDVRAGTRGFSSAIRTMKARRGTRREGLDMIHPAAPDVQRGFKGDGSGCVGEKKYKPIFTSH